MFVCCFVFFMINFQICAELQSALLSLYIAAHVKLFL